MISKITIEPRYQETDQMGVIHHSVYPVWYEVGRVKFLEDIGTTYQHINELGLHMAVIDLYSKYLHPVTFGQKVTLYTKVELMSLLKVKINYEIYDQHQVLLNQGYTIHAWLDANLKLINIEKFHPELYQLFKSKEEKKG